MYETKSSLEEFAYRGYNVVCDTAGITMQKRNAMFTKGKAIAVKKQINYITVGGDRHGET